MKRASRVLAARLSLLLALALLLTLALLPALTGCGYHVAGRSSRLPADVHVLAVPMFINQTQAYRVEQMLTKDVVREFIDRTHYHVVTDKGVDADAVLKGTVLSAHTSPLTYDSSNQGGRVSSAVVSLTMKITLLDRNGHVLFENPNYVFRQQYQVSREVTSFFEESTPALQRMSQDFARTMVTDILEAF